jgi:hypothetical protein
MEAQALASREYDKALAALLFNHPGRAEGAGSDEADADEEDGGGRAAEEEALALASSSSGALPRPVLSSALKLLWPVGVEEGQPTPLPGLSDLLGACDGATVGDEDGRSLAVEAPGGRVLVARLLLGTGDGSGGTAGGGAGGGGGTIAGGEPTVIVEEGAVPSVALQLTLSATDRGLLGLLKAACLQRLGLGAAVRTRRLALTQARMRALERAHHETTALAEALAADGAEAGMSEEGGCLGEWLTLAARAVEVAAALSREMDEACLLDLRPPPQEEHEAMEVAM